MDIRWPESKENPKLLELIVENILFRKILKSLFIRKLNALKNVNSREEFNAKWAQLEYEVALGVVFKILAKKSYFCVEIEKKLRERNITEKSIQAVVEYCRNKGYLNDDDLRKKVIANNIQKLKGPRAIAAKLKCRQAFTSDSVTLIGEMDQEKSIEEILPKLRKKYDLTTYAGKRKLFQALMRRGFDMDAVIRCLEVKSTL
jgi:regulatory protein